jgi:protein gp37
MADVYEEHHAVKQERLKLWELIEATPWLNWLLLTKRPENILKLSPWNEVWPDNVWIGTSVGLQHRAEARIPWLLEVPAVVRFLSCEPMLGVLDLTAWLEQLQWVICGGESGKGARPLDPAWARSLRDQCFAVGVPYYFKQWGGRYHHSGGRQLDGRTWDEIPPECASGEETNKLASPASLAAQRASTQETTTLQSKDQPRRSPSHCSRAVQFGWQLNNERETL